MDKLTEHGCSVENRDKVCRSRGGESCAFDGAMIVLQPIADTAHVVHGPIACCGNSWEGRGTVSRTGSLHRMGFTTDMNEMDIVYGSEEKLFRSIEQTSRSVKPQAIFVHATCVSGLIGEDIEAVCKKAEAELGIRVIPVNAPGFAGPKNLGNRIAGEVLLDHVIGTGEGSPPSDSPPGIGPCRPGKGEQRGVINLVGEYNIAGDLWLVEPLLKEAGIPVQARITGNSAFKEISLAHMAELNVVVCGRALINVAKGMESRYGTPYVEVSFFGKTETSKALRLIAGKLQGRGHRTQNADKTPGSAVDFGLLDSIEAVIAREENKLAERLKPYQHLKGKKAVLYTGGVKSWSFISALQDLGIEVVAVGTKKSTFEDEEKMKGILGPDAPLVEDVTPASLRRLMKDNDADMLIAGGRNLYLAVKEGFPFVDVNQERHIAYAGYEGLVNLAQQISNSIKFYAKKQGRGELPFALTVTPKSSCNSVVINPLKHSQSIGAAIALQGIDRALPVIHGAQGCTFLGKVLITKHFREPIALAGTKLFAEHVVMGSGDNIADAAEGLIDKQKPDLIAVLSSGLSEVKGDDIPQAIKKFRNGNRGCMIVHVSTPDYEGGMETGYAKAVEAVLRDALNGPAGKTNKINGQINILAGSHLTPADFSELREMVESFGLRPLMLPDLSALDGSREGFSPLASGGTRLCDVASMGRSAFTVAIGRSMEAAAKILKDRHDIEYRVLEGLSGLADTDTFMETLSVLGGKKMPPKYERQKKVLIDAMRDAHSFFGNKKICLALEPDLCIQTSRWLSEMGAEAELAVIPHVPENSGEIRAEKTVVGDLFSIEGDFDLLVSNSHAEDTAVRLGVPLYQAGFPVYKILGYTSRITVGYRGSLGTLHEAANLLSGKEKDREEVE